MLAEVVRALTRQVAGCGHQGSLPLLNDTDILQAAPLSACSHPACTALAIVEACMCGYRLSVMRSLPTLVLRAHRSRHRACSMVLCMHARTNACTCAYHTHKRMRKPKQTHAHAAHAHTTHKCMHMLHMHIPLTNACTCFTCTHTTQTHADSTEKQKL